MPLLWGQSPKKELKHKAIFNRYWSQAGTHALLSVVIIGACAGSGVNSDALPYATYGQAVDNAMPDGLKDNPSDNRCVQIGESIVTSKYVPYDDCIESFGAADVDALNLDSNYTLKIIDAQTASSIDFSTGLTADTASTCLPE